MNAEVFKAQRLTEHGADVPDMHISATFPIPEFGADYATLAPQRFDEQAQRIVDAMLVSLPGGTIDAVLRKLLEHRASLLIVRF